MCRKKSAGPRHEMSDGSDLLTSDTSGQLSVAIIGAGISGILSIKACKEYGSHFRKIVCFEKTSHIGGLWKFREVSSDKSHENVTTVQESTVANSSKEMSALSDFPPPAHWPNYLPHKMMLQYIDQYATHFQCQSHIKTGFEVTSLTKVDGRWRVTVVDHNSQHAPVTTEDFDRIIVATGHHSFASIPKFTGQDKFKGRIIHSAQYKSVFSNGIRPNSRVLVCGAGNSGIDIAVELSQFCDKVYLSCRRGFWTLPRVGFKSGRPYDVSMLTRFMHMLKIIVPIPLMQIVIETMLRKRFDHGLYGIRPNHPLFSEHPAVNDSLAGRIICGKVIPTGPIERLTEDGVVVGRHGSLQCDAIMCATGYHLDFPFLDRKVKNAIIDETENSVNLYKYVVYPNDPTLAFIGLPNALGPLFPIAEMQTRYLVQIWTQALPLPPRQEMIDDMQWYRNMRKRLFVDTSRHGTQVEWIPYMDDLAKQMNIKPHFYDLLTSWDLKLMLKCVFGPCVPYQYRLSGPDQWEGARDAILSASERVEEPFKRLGWKEPTGGSIKISVGPPNVHNSYSDYSLIFRILCGMLVVFFFELFTNLG